MVVRRFGVWSVAKLSAALYAALGLLIGLLVALVSVVVAGLAGAVRDGSSGGLGASSNLPPFVSAMFGVGAIIVMPIMYGLMGLVFGAITAALYNVVAGIVGGVEVQLDQ